MALNITDTLAQITDKPSKAEVVMYAEEGCVQLDKPWINGKPQCATMLFADAGRTKWSRVVHHHVAEGGLVESWDSRPNIRVTWAGSVDAVEPTFKMAAE